MPVFPRWTHVWAMTVAACFAASGCADMQAVEPIQLPPKEYRFGATVPIEFVHPAKVGVRCAERGAKFAGMPGLNSGACADQTLITMPNPCYTMASGWYARVLCHELGHVNGWSFDHQDGAWGDDAPIQPASESPQALLYEDFQAIEESARAVADKLSRDEAVKLTPQMLGLGFGSAALAPSRQ